MRFSLQLCFSLCISNFYNCFQFPYSVLSATSRQILVTVRVPRVLLLLFSKVRGYAVGNSFNKRVANQACTQNKDLDSLQKVQSFQNNESELYKYSIYLLCLTCILSYDVMVEYSPFSMLKLHLYILLNKPRHNQYHIICEILLIYINEIL